MEKKKFNYMLEIDILGNSSQNYLGVLRGAFYGFGCPKRHTDALLAKTMFLPGDDLLDKPTSFTDGCQWYRVPPVTACCISPLLSPGI